MNPLSNTDIRSMNKRRLAEFILRSPGISQVQLQKQIGLCSQTVNKVLKILEEEQIIERGEALSSTGGRPPIALRIKADAQYAVGADLLEGKIVICVVNLQGEVIAVSEEQIHEDWMPGADNLDSPEYVSKYSEMAGDMVQEELFTELLPQKVQEMLERLQIPHEKVLGLNLTVPGWIDGETWWVSAASNSCTHLREVNEAKLGIPFYIHRKEAAIGLAESWLTQQPSMMSLFLDKGVGGILVQNGSVDEGIHGHSWGVGHFLLHPHGRPCPCGRSGCFGAYCSSFVLLSEKYPTYERFFEAVDRNENDAAAQFYAYLSDLALGICSLAALTDRTIVISGAMADWLEPHLPRLEEEIRRINGPDFRVHLALGKLRRHAAPVAAAICLQKAYLEKLT